MSDLINRQDAIDALQKEINKGIPPFDDVMASMRCGVRLARNIIEDLPSAEKTGKWLVRTRHEHYPSGKEYQETVCSLCGHTDHNGDGSYCGYCGAKMEGGEKE